MASRDCSSIREAVLAYLGTQVEVSTVNGQCVVTLPFKTVDDRFIDVYIEHKLGDYVVVHDGGKSMAELFAQGIHLTDTQQTQLKSVARRHGVVVQHGTIQATVRAGESMYESILAIAQCASMAMMPVVSHEPVIEDEPLSARVARALNRWKPDYVDIKRRSMVRGRRAEHVFDFVAHVRKADAHTVAIKVLPPSYGPRIQADRYGFMVLDIEGRVVDKWARLAVMSRIEEWPNEAVEIVRTLSSDTIELETDAEERVEALLPQKMNTLVEAA